MERETLGDRILSYLSDFPGATDGELAAQFKRSHQTINATCRNLCNQGRLLRRLNPEKGFLGNYPAGMPSNEESAPAARSFKADPGEALEEEAIKHILSDLLTKDGWDVQTAWGHTLGPDIDARRAGERWVLEVKGPGSSHVESKYFDNILGEILRRMDDPNARYSIVFPDKKVYRDRWDKLPRLAKERIMVDLLLVGPDGAVDRLI